MSIILLDKNNLKFLKEDLTSGTYNPLNPYSSKEVDPTSMVADKSGGAGASRARLEYLKGQAQKNLGKLGISGLDGYMDTQGIFMAKRIKEYGKPFGFSFQTETGKYKGKAKYNESESEEKQTIVLDFIGDDGGKKLIEFTQESLKRPFMGKSSKMFSKWKGDKRALVGLQEEAFFDAIVTDMGGSKPDEEKEGEESTSDYSVGDEVNFKTDDGEEGSGTISKIDGDEYTIKDSKGNEITINIKNITGKKEVSREEQSKEGNYYNGKDLKEVNKKLFDAKDKANFFKIISQYKDDEDFQKIFLDAIIDSTKSITINKKPLMVTLKELKGLGLLGEGMSTRERNYKKFKLNFQNFMFDVFYLFSKMTKDGKQSKTLEVIREFLKQLYFIAIKGKTIGSDAKAKKVLWRKLLGNFNKFLKDFIKLSEMSKGGVRKEKGGKEVNIKSSPKASMGTMSTTESYINDIAKFTYLIKEEDEKEEPNEEGEKSGEVEKIKVLTIAIPRGKESEEDVDKRGEEVKKGPLLFSDKVAVPVKATLEFGEEEDEGIFKKSIKSEISGGLSKGLFFARLSQKPQGAVLIFTKSSNSKDPFFTLRIENVKSIKDPKQWSGEVTVGDKAMGDKDFKGVKAEIKNVKISNK